MNDLDIIIRRAHHNCLPEACAKRPPDALGQPWPCDTRVVLDALDKRWQEWARAIDFLNKHAADADRLAEALRRRQCLCTQTHPWECDRCKALRQHDEAKP